MNLRYILEWAWDKVVHTKEELDGICEFFSFSFPATVISMTLVVNTALVELVYIRLFNSQLRICLVTVAACGCVFRYKKK